MPADRRWVFHAGSQGSGWWLYIGRLCRGSSSVALPLIGWGWDCDVPWSWLPTLHVTAAGEWRSRDDVRHRGAIWLSWLGFTIGGLVSQKNALPAEVSCAG